LVRVRNIARRLERLERRVLAASESFAVTIQFVHPEKGVTRTLLVESGKQVLTRPEAPPDLTPVSRNAPDCA
jgi:hypothetical protein